MRTRAPASGVQIALERGAAVEGDVLDEEGRPVAGARVWLAPRASGDADPDAAPEVSRMRASSDANGHFRIDGLEPGALEAFASTAPIGADPFEQFAARFTHAPVQVPRTGTARVELRFTAGLSIAGTVVDPEGAGIVGARVTARETRPMTRGAPNVDAEAPSQGSALTDAHGQFTIGNLAAGEHLVAAQKEGYEDRGERSRAAAGDQGLRLVLAPLGFVRGRVLGEGGAPVARFRVDDAPAAGGDGRLAIPIRRDGALTFRISAEGYAPLQRTMEVSRGRDLDLGDLVLGRGRDVVGQVVDADTGAGIAAARIAPAAGADERRYVSRSVTNGVLSGVDGRFVLHHVEDRTVLRIEREGYMPATSTVGPDPASVVVRLARGGTIAVHVLGADGEARRQFAVGLFGRGELGKFEQTDARGWYEFSGLPAGTYVVQGLEEPNPGLGPRVVELEERVRVEIELRARDSGTTVELSVSGPGAADLEEVFVGLLPGDAPPVRSLSDVAGVIRPATMDARRSIPLLAPGRYSIIVLVHDGDGVRFLTRPVEVGPGPLQVVDVAVPSDLPILPR